MQPILYNTQILRFLSKSYSSTNILQLTVYVKFNFTVTNCTPFDTDPSVCQGWNRIIHSHKDVKFNFIINCTAFDTMA